MPDFTPTAEQLAIITAARETSDNLAVVARAGAAKTSTLVLVAEALPTTDILCLAFNKAIATEMSERLPANCEAKTLHSLGFKAWAGFIGGRCKITDRKVYYILKDLIEEMPQGEAKSAAFSSMSETLDYIRKGKQIGWLPNEFRGHWKSLFTDEEYLETLPTEVPPEQFHLIKQVSAESFRRALKGQIDFDDMIFCPALCSVSWPRPSLTLVDEAQDLSPLNHHVLRKLVKNRRIIAVGDPYQAIYGFRGADVKSMQTLATTFNMTELRLTVSFRCARAITENAQWRAADMQAPAWAADGLVLRPESWTPEHLAFNDAIICRNNAPLFSIAIKLLEAGQLPQILGRDLAGPLTKILKGLGKESDPSIIAEAALEEWRGKELRRAKSGAVGQIEDRFTCILTMLRRTDTLGEAIEYLNYLLNLDGRIYLMTGHKSKGLEYDRVWFLDPQLCRVDKYEQDANIKYVIETRAKKQLAYVSSETFAAASNVEEVA